MTPETTALLERNTAARPTDAPQTQFVVAPDTPQAAADLMRAASDNRLRTLIWGAGTHQARGTVSDPDVLLVTDNLNGVIAYVPDDLTLVAGAGTTLGTIDDVLAEAGQTALLPELSAESTIGGVIAAGLSGWKRLRYGPTRDRVLETTLATGDGRLVRGGGRVVKNATGYDLPKLITGSHGSLGVITSVCLKIWPRPAATATVTVESPEAAATAYRPLAIIETIDATRVYLAGRPAEIEAQAEALGAAPNPGLDFPEHIDAAIAGTLLVAPGSTATALSMLRSAIPTATYQAAHGVGEVRFGCEADDVEDVIRLRSQVEGMGGRLVRTGGTDIDPWGTPPPGLELQRSVKAAFDPMSIANPGRLPGGL